MEGLLIVLLFFSILLLCLTRSASLDTLAANQVLRDGGETIISAGENFELGFFSPGTSKYRYLGIWYKKITTGRVVWVANRETPLMNTSGMLKVSSKGNLLLLNGNTTMVWSSNSSATIGDVNPVAQLLDTGNLVLWDKSSIDQENLIWQSFDHPCDTLLAGMKLGKDFVTGRDRHLTSWKSFDDPSPGQYVFWMDTNGFPQIFERQGSVLHSRFGPWNGLRFSGVPTLRSNRVYRNEFVVNEKEIYYKFEMINNSVASKIYLTPEGIIQRLNWIDAIQSWSLYLPQPIDSCIRYGLCGPYGSCNMNNDPACSCMDGFEPRDPEQRKVADWSNGCRRKTPLDCGKGDSFQKISGVKLPDTRNSWYNLNMTLEDCEMACKRNCTCTAFANLDIRNGGSGCLLWFDELMDVRTYDDIQNLYIRMAVSKSAHTEFGSGSSSNKKKEIIKVVLSASAGLVLLGLMLVVYAWNKTKRSHTEIQDFMNESENEDTELSYFSLSKIVKSTNNFSINNKLGEGGFGPVYKGVLEEGLEIAVKRLSRTSRQGLDEFKNEVRCIAKLQHRNLVKLLGCCIQGDEIMLIYEYMPNKSLDLFIFDESRSSVLDWAHRFHIIHGIARGLLYLHQDSRLRIIHRDLKAGNILLDIDMNPKISDFGLARMFQGHESEATTSKVVGTLGYISPEYAVNGLFSVKSDVFSFGVLVLEIVSGKRNRGFSHEQHSDNLLGHAWRLYKQGKSLELASEHFRHSCINSEVLRSIHVGLLCVQHHAIDRPTMSSVVLMLGNEGVLPPPNHPAFSTAQSAPELDSTSSMLSAISFNEVTVTSLDAR